MASDLMTVFDTAMFSGPIDLGPPPMEPMADYSAARSSQYKSNRPGIPSMGASADYHIRSSIDFLKILEGSREFERNTPVAPGVFDRLSHNVIQGGFVCNPETGDKALDADLAADWTGWGEDPDECDLEGERTWHERELIACRRVIADGDCFHLLIDNGTVQDVEAHRPRTPAAWSNQAAAATLALIHGVLIDRNRRRLEYWFTKDDLDPWRTVAGLGDCERYPVRDERGNRVALHCYRPNRFSQTRGIGVLAPVFELFAAYDDIQFAKVLHQQLVSCFVMIRKRMDGYPVPPSAAGSGMPTTAATPSSGQYQNRFDYRPGIIYDLPDGMDAIMHSPNVPNPEFFPHMRLILQLISIAAGLPLNLLLLDPSDTNFSGWRGAIDQARLNFRAIQRCLAARLHRPTYKWRVLRLMRKDPAIRHAAERSDVSIFRHRWSLPSWPYIEPLKDASAALIKEANGLTSPRRRHADDGNIYSDIVTETVDDRALAIRTAVAKAKQLKAEDPDLEIHWRDLLPLPNAQGVHIQIADTEDVSSANDEEKEEVASG